MRLSQFLILIVASLACLLLSEFAFPDNDPFLDSDAVDYLEAAQSLRAGRGLTIRAWGWREFRESWQPLQDFPPGMSLATYAMSLIGLAPRVALAWLPRIAHVLLPFAIFFALRRVVRSEVAIVVAAVTPLLSGTLAMAALAMSDVPHVLFIAVGFGLFFEGLHSRRIRYAFGAGLAIGCALLFRNVAAVAPIAIGSGMLGALALGAVSFRDALRLTGSFAVGGALLYVPSVMRNLELFGAALPWVRVPGGMPVVDVLREVLRSWNWLFFGDRMHQGAFNLLLVLAVGVAVVIVVRRRHTLSRLRVVGAMILGLYALGGMALLASVRARYLVDPIDDRFLLQYHWIVLAGLFAVVWEATRAAGKHAALVRVTLFALGAIGLLTGQLESATTYRKEFAEKQAVIESQRPLVEFVRSLPGSTVVVSSVGPLMRLEAERSVLYLDDVSAAELVDHVCKERNLVVLLSEPHETNRPGWIEGPARTPPTGFREVARVGNAVAWAHARLGVSATEPDES